ncbi:MAG: GFA family protein [Myxococcales bacterium]|nr:GFA family protein [Myxococcales bacterium]
MTVEPRIFEGGCHCRAVRFAVTVRELVAYDCNCSVCRMKGFLHLIVEPSDFVLHRGSENLREYRFNTGVAVHKFCATCGIHSFYTPRSHPNSVDVNVYCLDGVETSALFEVAPFDGQNWEASISGLPGSTSS